MFKSLVVVKNMYLLLLSFGCFPEIRPPEEERFIDNPAVDNDGDTFSEEDGDCNDRDDEIHPGAEELCDGVDNDCNEIIDDNPSDIEIYYQDMDGDGFGVEGNSILSCPADKPIGYIEAKERNGVVVFDCNDTPPDEETGEQNGRPIHPDAEEICDEVDNDCDEQIDEEIDTAPIWYLDNDNDSFGDIEQKLKACPVNGDEPPAGYVDNSADCDDQNGTAYPNADEWCNEVDDNCNGVVDEATAMDAPLWYADADADGFGSVLNVVPSCNQPGIELSDGTIVDYVSDNTDCNDSDPQVSPIGTETCDNIDNDCDGFIDEGSGPDAPQDAITFYADVDSDGYGTDSQTILQCAAPFGFVSNPNDCDDFSASINPSIVENCNGIDDNCDGAVDESGALGETIFYLDVDGDGFGISTQVQSSCSQPVGYAAEYGDCDDGDASIFPTANEVCDEIDNNCDALIDDADPAVVFGTDDVWFMDGDGDGFGIPGSFVQQCLAPQGYVDNTDDCNDTKAFQYPGAPERCNNQDDDCDGIIDNDPVNMVEWYVDGDADGHGSLIDQTSLSTAYPNGYDLLACPYFDPSTGLPEFQPGYSRFNDDCNDFDPAISPSASELCSPNVDENCDGLFLAGATDFNTYVVDFDMDGYANSTARPNGTLIYAFESCLKPLGYIPYNPGDVLDCNDLDTEVHPYGMTEHTHQLVGGGTVTHTHAERINGKVDLCENDWNGDLTPPQNEWDDDGDGYVEGVIDSSFLYNPDGTVNGWAGTQVIYGGQDCDDTDPLAYPYADEICNGAFEDCFASDFTLGGSPGLETDDDGDGYVECTGYDALTWEAAPVTGGNDCNDSIADLFPRFHPDTQLSACFADYNGDGYPDRDWNFCDSELTSADSEGVILGTGGKMGWDVVYAGDVDGDGLDDVLASAIYNSEGEFFGGAVYLFLGSTLNANMTLDASNADYTFYGINGQGYLGRHLASAGDVDGDGLDDIMFSSVESAGFAGVVYLFLGSSLTTPGEVDISTADVIFEGEIGGGSLNADQLGSAMATAGDVDGDGLDDILLGAPSATVNAISNAGKVYLILGSSLDSSGTFDVSTSDVIFTGEGTYANSGSAVSSAGDIDGDGLDDILIGAPNHSYARGHSYLILASSLDFTGPTELVNSDYIFVGDGSNWVSGATVLNVGDVNGGGVPDIGIAAPYHDISTEGVAGQDKGRVFVFFGETLPPPGSIFLSTADLQFVGDSKGEKFGRSLSSTVDLDGDGLSDLIMGAHQVQIDGDNNSGRVNVFFGGNLPYSGEVFRSQADVEIVGGLGEHFGHGLVSNGDINGDGLSDVLIGAPYNTDNGNGAGKVSIVLACEQ